MPKEKLVMDDTEFIKWATEYRLEELRKNIRDRKTLLKKLKDRDTEDEESYISCKLYNWSILAGDETAKEVRNYDDEYADETARRIVEGLRMSLSKEIEAFED